MVRDRSVAWPLSAPALEGRGAAAIDRRLHAREDGPLNRGGDEDVGPRVVTAQRVGCFVLVAHLFPDLPEDHTGDEASGDTRGEAERTVGDLGCFRHALCVPLDVRLKT